MWDDTHRRRAHHVPVQLPRSGDLDAFAESLVEAPAITDDGLSPDDAATRKEQYRAQVRRTQGSLPLD